MYLIRTQFLFWHNPHFYADPGASCSTQEELIIVVNDSLPQDQKTDKSTEGDLNATFGKLADLRSMIYKFVLVRL